MPIRIGYKPCTDCGTEIKRCGSRKRCQKCQGAYEIVLANRRLKIRIVPCKYCGNEFRAKSSKQNVCNAPLCRAKQDYRVPLKATIPVRAREDRISARPLGAYSGDKFARKVTEWIRTNG